MEYRLQVSTNTFFTGTLVVDIAVGDNFYCDLSAYDIPELTTGVQYYWRVVDSDGVASAPAAFRVATNDSPFLLEMSNDNFVSLCLNQVTSSLEYSPLAPLARDTEYKWRVSGNGQDTSAAGTFRTKIALAAPVGGTATILNKRTIRVSWDPVAGASSYDVVYKTHVGGEYDGTGLVLLSSLGEQEGESVFHVPVTDLTNPNDPYIDLGDGMTGVTYWFAVRANDEEMSSAYVEVPNGLSGLTMRESIPPSIIAAHCFNNKMLLEWTPSPDAVQYRLFGKVHDGGEYDGCNLRVAATNATFGAFIDINVTDLQDKYHPALELVGGRPETSYWFAVSTVDNGADLSAKAEMVDGFQLLLLPTENVRTSYEDGCFLIKWDRKETDGLTNEYLVFYKNDPAALGYNGTGLRLESPVGAEVASPVLVTGGDVCELKLYGCLPNVPYWFAVASRDIMGNTTLETKALNNVTSLGQIQSAVFGRSPKNLCATINQGTKEVELRWDIVEENQ